MVAWWARPVSTTSAGRGVGQRRPLHRGTGLVMVARRDGDRGAPAGAGGQRGGGRRGDARGDLAADTAGRQRLDLLGPPRAHERVAALEPHHPLPAGGPGGEQVGDGVGGPGGPVRRSADVAALSGGRRQREDRFGGGTVGHDDVGRAEQRDGPPGEQERVTRARSDEVDDAGHRPSWLTRHRRVEGGGGDRAAAPLADVGQRRQAAGPQRRLGVGRADETDREADHQRRVEPVGGGQGDHLLQRGRRVADDHDGTGRPALGGHPHGGGRDRQARFASTVDGRPGPTLGEQRAGAGPSGGDRHHVDVGDHRCPPAAGRRPRLRTPARRRRGCRRSRHRRRRGSPGPPRPGSGAASGRDRPARRRSGSSPPRSGAPGGPSRPARPVAMVAAGDDPTVDHRRVGRPHQHHRVHPDGAGIEVVERRDA